MVSDIERANELILSPSENLNTEVKSWIDPRTPEGQAKIVTGISAIYNRNGGYFIIGLDNKSLKPDSYPFDRVFNEIFHQDIIQALLSKHCAPSIPIEIVYTGNFHNCPLVIFVPAGVKVPASIKKGLQNSGGKPIFQTDEIYFRTLNANGTASTAKLSSKDLPDLLEICFNNREADVARFLRRNFTPEAIASLLGNIVAPKSVPDHKEMVFSVLDNGMKRLELRLTSQPLSPKTEYLRSAFSMSVGLSLTPQKNGELPTRGFMNLIRSSNPNLTGWPIWLDSTNFHDKAAQPRVLENAWETYISGGSFGRDGLEFQVFDPRGNFFLHRVMQEDISDNVARGTVVDPVLITYRVAETIIVGLAFARALGWQEDDMASFAFRFNGASGRHISGWASPERFFSFAGYGKSETNTCDSFTEVPVGTAPASIAHYVKSIVAPLLVLFGGFSISDGLFEDCVTRLIERRM